MKFRERVRQGAERAKDCAVQAKDLAVRTGGRVVQTVSNVANSDAVEFIGQTTIVMVGFLGSVVLVTIVLRIIERTIGIEEPQIVYVPVKLESK
jgi:hypothetical protein